MPTKTEKSRFNGVVPQYNAFLHSCYQVHFAWWHPHQRHGINLWHNLLHQCLVSTLWLCCNQSLQVVTCCSLFWPATLTIHTNPTLGWKAFWWTQTLICTQIYWRKLVGMVDISMLANFVGPGGPGCKVVDRIVGACDFWLRTLDRSTWRSHLASVPRLGWNWHHWLRCRMTCFWIWEWHAEKFSYHFLQETFE